MRTPRLPVGNAIVFDEGLARRVRTLVATIGVVEAKRVLGVSNDTLQDAREGAMRLDARARILAALERDAGSP